MVPSPRWGMPLRPLHAGSEKLILRDGRLMLSGTANLSIQSSAFEANSNIPRRYSSEGENISPPLSWSGIPNGTRELLLICEDPDAPKTEPFVHWILSFLPPELTSLPEAVPTTQVVPSLANARQAKNSGGKIGYMGPMPPMGMGFIITTSSFSHSIGKPRSKRILAAKKWWRP